MKPIRFLLCLLALVQSAMAVTGTTLYQTSFERPGFTPGQPLRGQDNWEMYHDGEAISVSTTNARTGLQCLQFNGALLEQNGPNSTTAYGFSRALDAYSNNPPAIVEISASVRLDGPGTGTKGTPDQDILSANLMAVVPRGDGLGQSLGGFFVSSAGKIWSYSADPADAYKYSVPYTFGTYRKLRLRVDFVARTLEYFVDDVSLGSVGFPASITTDRLFGGYIYLNGALEPVDTPELKYRMGDYTAYFDDYSIVSVPLSPVNAVIEFGALTSPFTNFLAAEFEPVAKVRVIRRGFADAAVRATVVTSDGTARAGEHYAATSTFVTFAAGETSKTVEIPLAPDDAWAEKDATFTVCITDLPPGASSTRPAASVIIRDDDRPGSIDSSWSSTLGLPPLKPGEIRWVDARVVLKQPDGKTLLNAVVFPEDYSYPLYWRLVRINPDGSVDPTYPIRDSVAQNPNGHVGDQKTATFPDGSVVVWASEHSDSEFLGYEVRYKLNPDGSVDERFPGITTQRGAALELIPLSDGKVLVAEPSAPILLNGQRMPWLFRLNADGTVDGDFRAPTNISGTVRLLGDDQLFVEQGFRSTARIHRLGKDGRLDPSFTAPTNLKLQRFLHRFPDGRFLVGAFLDTEFRVYRLNENGTVDSGFTVGVAVWGGRPGSIDKVFPQPDGKLVLAGIFGTYNGQRRGSIVRLNGDGSVDTTYQTGEGAKGVPGDDSEPGQLYAAGMLGDGRLLLPGYFNRFNGQTVSPPIILNADGTRDPHFEGTVAELIEIGPPYLVGPAGTWGGGIHYLSGYGLGRLRMDLPLRIVSHAHDGLGTNHLTANALAGRSYILQTSENLADWTDLLTQVASTNRVDFIDAPATATPRRFYRVKQK